MWEAVCVEKMCWAKRDWVAWGWTLRERRLYLVWRKGAEPGFHVGTVVLTLVVISLWEGLFSTLGEQLVGFSFTCTLGSCVGLGARTGRSLTVPRASAIFRSAFLVVSPASRLRGSEGAGLDRIEMMSSAACFKKSIEATSGTEI